MSSGQRINRASDDATGLAVALSLNVSSRVFTQGIRNLNDAVSAGAIAEGALTSLRDITLRQKELTEQAANGTYSTTQRQVMNKEVNSLVDEWNRITQSTTFNGLNILDPNLGTVVIQAGFGNSGTLSIGFSDQLKRAVGDGTFQTAVTLQSANSGTAWVSAADLNGDGNLDIISADQGGGLSIHLGNGNGTFAATTSYNSGGVGALTAPIAIADLNGDGKLDLATTNFGGDFMSVTFGNGDGTFRPGTNYSTPGATPYYVVAGDVNGDGKIDLITSEINGHNVGVFINNGNGTFQAASSFATAGASPNGLTLGDFNGDGRIDLAVGEYSYTNELSIFIGKGDGSFSTATSIGVGGVKPGKVAAYDINGDGILDLVSADKFSGDVSLILGNGDGTFKLFATFQVGGGGSSPASISVADFNGDGRADIVTANRNNTASVLIGNGNGTFQASRDLTSGGIDPIFVATGDFNNDGRLDFATADTGSADVSVFTQNGYNTTSSAYLNISSQQGAKDTMSILDANLSRVESQLGTLGATTSRFSTALASLQTESLGYTTAAGRITDTDIASESAQLLSTQILQQSASAILAQANQQPSLVLLLLRG